MPQAKGVEPFSRYWVVEWQVLGRTSKLMRYRVELHVSEQAAKDRVAQLKSQAQQVPGGINPTGVFDPWEIDFFNRKIFVTQLFTQLASIPSVID